MEKPEQASLSLYNQHDHPTPLTVTPCGMRICYCHHANSICAYTHTRAGVRAREEMSKERKNQRKKYLASRAMQIDGIEAIKANTTRPN